MNVSCLKKDPKAGALSNLPALDVPAKDVTELIARNS
jgi:hypothetical protein